MVITLCTVFLSNCLCLAITGPEVDWIHWFGLDGSGQLEDALHCTQLRLLLPVLLLNQVRKL